ncbi:MAG: SAM-dependent methyltransferase [Oscillospiraceae bacterium]|nr:SAM-dependent methyltransferase [Oscillospiraceae bacterium]
MENYRHSAKSFREELKAKGVFYTAPEMAEYMKKLLPDDVQEIYDPTCGNGGLLSAFGDDVQKYGQDIDGEQVRIAEERLQNFHGVTGDTLAAPAFLDRKFQYIIANPPFSVKWNPVEDERFSDAPVLPPPGKADYAFILHILYLLAENGKAVVMNFPGILYRGQREGKIRQWLCEQNYIERVIAIPGKKFEDTQIATCILILNKSKQTTDIIFRDEETQLEKTVSLEEVKAQDFNLSVSSYIQIETEKEEIDINTLNSDIENSTLAHLKATLDMMLMLNHTVGEKRNIAGFLTEILNIVHETTDKLKVS